MTKLKLKELAWEPRDLARALETLLHSSRVAPGVELAALGRDAELQERRDWLIDGGRHAGVDGFWHTPIGEELVTLLREERALLFPLSLRDETLIVVSNGTSCRVIGPAHEVTCSIEEFVPFLENAVFGQSHGLGKLLHDLPGGIEAAKRFRAINSVGEQPLFAFTYQCDGASSFATQFLARRGHVLLGSLLFVSLLRIAITTMAAFTLGRAALDGLVDTGRVLAWTLVSVASVPLTYWTTLAAQRLAIITARIVKSRVLEGAFFLDEDVLRRQGYGAGLARLNEASVVERTGVTELFGLVTPVSLLLGAAALFVGSAFPIALSGLLFGFIVLALLAGHGHARAYGVAYAERLTLTEDVIDKIIGHRTRAVQQHPGQHHVAEDRDLVRYSQTLEARDSRALRSSLIGRGWTLVIAAYLVYQFVLGANLATLLTPVVGAFLAASALTSITMAYSSGAVWLTAWRAVAPLFASGSHRERKRRAEVNVEVQDDLPTALAVSSVSFSYRPGGRMVLTDVSTRISRGEKVLLEGPSGGGKSTFAKLIAGELRPRGGTLLVGGLDAAATAESQWRDAVASTPQFHENHIFSNSFVFNIDPKDGSVVLSPGARELCDELGLGDLLDRMPGGPTQILGETGWQLSHGERSRVFVARSLLQDSKLVLFDESFAALDPVTLAAVVDCVRKRAETLIVIAHT